MIGIDEVGRGSWAGPLLVCAVDLSDDVTIEGLTDSKKLSYLQRNRLELAIKHNSNQIEMVWVSPKFIDQNGLTASMAAACKRLISFFSNQKQTIIVDGNIDYLDMKNSEAIIRAESKYPAVAAASVVAKQARDAYMVAAGKCWPAYSFEKNVGYGTSLHKQALVEHGVCSIHRKSYKPIKELL